MPRGATQPIRARSRQDRALPQVANATVNGRTTNCASRNTPTPAASMPSGKGQCSRAASSTKSTDTSTVVRFSLKSRMSSMWMSRTLPSTMPMMVTASSPDSWVSVLEMLKASSTTESTA